MVDSSQLVAVATLLRDDPGIGADFLEDLTSIDWPDRFEVVYHLYNLTRQEGPLRMKVRADKADPRVPSTVPVWPGADLMEREVYDMMGITFAGHPNLKRILMWEGFQGHPLRKDWKEAYFEEEKKPFDQRWPEGALVRAENRTPFKDNIVLPSGFDPTKYTPPAEDNVPLVEYNQPLSGEMKSQTLIVNMGPQHPSTHGVFRMRVRLDGERIVDLQPVIGYMHRNHEKIGERNAWLMNMPYTDRLDYLCSMGNNFGYAIAVEKLMPDIKVPERAEYLRVIMAEFTRIVNHFFALGQLLSDMGAFFTPMLYAIEEREWMLDLFEMASGSRMMCNYARFGGVARDVPPEFMPLANKLVNDRLPRAIDRFDDYIATSEIVLARAQNVGILTKEQAIALSTVGPVLRASGVPYDVRRAEPYSIYDRFDFDIPIGTVGDVYDRYLVRIAEMRESVRILKQALRDIPAGEIFAGRKGWQVKIQKGEAYGRIENPKGATGFYVVSDGGTNPYRYHIHAPSFINIGALGTMAKGHTVADTVIILGSVDIVLGELDR
ncbi:MAG: NADH-quinone oxidoreductase subunit D [Chloroflexi bacterium]|nr:NADH-quinone oxidoreductase subunit D [Chloroflexota bacterium]